MSAMAASDQFFRQNGRWPESKSDLESMHGLDKRQLDLEKLENMRFRNKPDGSLDVFWTEGHGLNFTSVGVGMHRPTTMPATRNAAGWNS
jgi:hypothetical protein